MKIFPIKPMSNYDSFKNWLNLMDNKNIDIQLSKADKYGVKITADTDRYFKKSIGSCLLDKFYPSIKQIVSKLKDSYGKKSSIN